MFLQNSVIKNALGIDNKDSKVEVIEIIKHFLDNNSDSTDTILRIGFENYHMILLLEKLL